MATLAATVLKDAPPRFVLAGLSMGGIVCFEIWRQAPERIAAMALLDTNPHEESQERRSAREKNMQRVSRGELREVMAETLTPLYLAKRNKDNEQFLSLILAMGMDLGKESFLRQNSALGSRLDSVATLSTITVPTLVLCGEEDKLCSVALHELMAGEIPAATLAVLKDCGHLSPIEQPELVNRALASLLDSCDATH